MINAAYKKPKGIERRGNAFFVRMIVPADVRAIIGQSVLIQTLGGDADKAFLKAPLIQAEWKAKIKAAREGMPVDQAVKEWKAKHQRPPRVDPVAGSAVLAKAVMEGIEGPSELIDMALAEAGLRDTPEARKAIGLALFAAHRSSHLQGEVQEASAALETASKRSRLFDARHFPEAVPVQPVALTGVTLAQLYEHFGQHGRPRRAPQITKDDQVVKRLGEFLGGADVDIGLFTKTRAKEFWSALQKLPARRNAKAMQALDFHQLIEAGGEPVSVHTLYQWRSTLNRLFGYAVDSEWLERNPVAGIDHDFSGRLETKPDAIWEPDMIASYFSGPMFTGHDPDDDYRLKVGLKVIKDWRYWLPILQLFSGTRSGEWAWATKSEIVWIDGIMCLDLTKRPVGNDDGPSVKNRPSKRIIPIHKTILRLGFKRYVELLEGDKLFPELWTAKAGASKKASSWYNARREFDGSTRTLHDFRHTAKNWFRSSSEKEELHDLLTGHTNGSIGRTYGHGAKIKSLKKVMDALDYPSFPL